MKNAKTPLNTQIYEQASEWFVEFRSGELDPAARRRFFAWLRSSPEHMRAYLELAAIWNEGPKLDPQRLLDGLDLGEPETGNVVPFERTEAAAKRSTPGAQAGTRFVHWRVLAASLATVCLLGGASYLYSQRNVYSTGVGEQRTFTLSDGSTIQLNTRSAVRVDYHDDERDVTLEEGQALFKVARDTQRPFIVTADQTHVRAVGTQFDVNRRANGTTVTVVEGRVAVGTDSINSPPALLSAGEQAIVIAHETRRAGAPNMDAVTAWTQQRLVFESTPLEEVATEFNRYNRRALVIEGRELAHLRITGTFSSADPSSLVRFLRARPGIVVSESKGRIVVTVENSSAR